MIIEVDCTEYVTTGDSHVAFNEYMSHPKQK